MTRHPDGFLRDYLQRVVGDRGKTMVTAVDLYDTWAELPWDDELPDQRPQPLPEGRAVAIEMRDVYLSTALPGPPHTVVLSYEQDRVLIAAQLANLLIGARRGAG